MGIEGISGRLGGSCRAVWVYVEVGVCDRGIRAGLDAVLSLKEGIDCLRESVRMLGTGGKDSAEPIDADDRWGVDFLYRNVRASFERLREDEVDDGMPAEILRCVPDVEG